MQYNETLCADPWVNANTPQSEKKKDILNYFKEAGIDVLEIKFKKLEIPVPACAMCPCLSGTSILCRVKKEDIGFMEDEGFLPYDTIK